MALAERELESLLIRIKVKAEELTSNTSFLKPINDLAAQIKSTVEGSLRGIVIDKTDLAKEMSAIKTMVKNNIADLNDIAKIKYKISTAFMGDLSKIGVPGEAFAKQTSEKLANVMPAFVPNYIDRLRGMINELGKEYGGFSSEQSTLAGNVLMGMSEKMQSAGADLANAQKYLNDVLKGNAGQFKSAKPGVIRDLEKLKEDIKTQAAGIANAMIDSGQTIATAQKTLDQVVVGGQVGKAVGKTAANAQAEQLYQLLGGKNVIEQLTSNAEFGNFAARVTKLHADISKVGAVPNLMQFITDVKLAASDIQGIKFSKLGDITGFVDSVVKAHEVVTKASIAGVQGLALFASDLRKASIDIRRAYNNLEPVRPLLGLAGFARSVSTAYQQLMGIQPLPNLVAMAAGLRSLRNSINAIAGVTNFGQFASNITRVKDSISSLGSSTGLNKFAIDANNAATALGRLNAQMGMFNGMFSNFRPPRIPTGGTTAVAGGGGWFGGGGRNQHGVSGRGLLGGADMFSPSTSFGFNPLRRVLGMATSMGTALAVSFLGYEMVRQVTQFDEQMTQAMATADMHMRMRGVSLQEGFTMSGVRQTVQNEILRLSMRTATSAHELAQAYRELTAAGHGTRNALAMLPIAEQFAYVNNMDASKAVTQLTVLQRQLNLVSTDAAENARNFERMADAITVGAQLSFMGTERFLNGLQRIVPHLRFLNRGLEDGVALLAAFGRIDPSTAVARSEALLRALTSQFVRSELEVPTGRTGARPQNSPVGANFRAFHLGQGVHPVHMMTESVRTASHAWARYGINLFDSRQQFVGVTSAIQQLDRAIGHLPTAQKELALSELFPGQLRSAASVAIRALLMSREAMEAFALAARNADGTMRNLASIRLQSFSAQATILKNNLIVIGTVIGQVLAPILAVLNGLLLNILDSWWNLGNAGRYTVVALAMIVVGLAALRFTVPVLIGLFRILFWDSIVAGARIAMFAVYAMIVPLQIAYMSMMGVSAAISWLRLQTVLTGAAVWVWNASLWAGGVTLIALKGLMIGLTAVYKFFALAVVTEALLIHGALAVTASIGSVVSFVWTVLTGTFFFFAGAVHWVVTSLFTVNTALFFTAGLGSIVKGVFWLLTGGTFTLAGAFAVLTGVIGTTLTALLALVAAMWLLQIAAAAASAALGFLISMFFAIATSGAVLVLTGIAAALTTLVGLAQSVEWNGFWSRFEGGARTAFWNVVGYIANLRENMTLLGQWLSTHMPVIASNLSLIINTVLQNLTENVEIAMARLERALLTGFNRIISNVLNPFLSSVLGQGPTGYLNALRDYARLLRNAQPTNPSARALVDFLGARDNRPMVSIPLLSTAHLIGDRGTIAQQRDARRRAGESNEIQNAIAQAREEVFSQLSPQQQVAYAQFTAGSMMAELSSVASAFNGLVPIAASGFSMMQRAANSTAQTIPAAVAGFVLTHQAVSNSAQIVMQRVADAEGAAANRIQTREEQRLQMARYERPLRGLFDLLPRTVGIGPLQINTTVPDEVRNFIENLFTPLRDRGLPNELDNAVNQIGNTFREISLERFVLEQTPMEDAAEAARMEQERRDQERNRLLQELLNWFQNNPLGGAPGPWPVN